MVNLKLLPRLKNLLPPRSLLLLKNRKLQLKSLLLLKSLLQLKSLSQLQQPTTSVSIKTSSSHSA